MSIQQISQQLYTEKPINDIKNEIVRIERIDSIFLYGDPQSRDEIMKYLKTPFKAKYLDDLLVDAIFTKDSLFLRPVGKVSFLPALVGIVTVTGLAESIGKATKIITSSIIQKSQDINAMGNIPNELANSLPRWALKDLSEIGETLPSWSRKTITAFTFNGDCNIRSNVYKDSTLKFYIQGSASLSKKQNLAFSVLAPYINKTLADVVKI